MGNALFFGVGQARCRNTAMHPIQHPVPESTRQIKYTAFSRFAVQKVMVQATGTLELCKGVACTVECIFIFFLLVNIGKYL